jgi:hypothetical protein
MQHRIKRFYLHRTLLDVQDTSNPEDPIVITGVKKTKKKPLTAADKLTNKLIAAHRAPNEHGFAFLKNWRRITKLRTCPTRSTTLLRALLVLANLENAR